MPVNHTIARLRVLKTELRGLIDTAIREIEGDRQAPVLPLDERVSRLESIARVLGVPSASFHVPETTAPGRNPSPIEAPNLSADFQAIKDPRARKTLLDLTRILASTPTQD